MLRIKDDGIGPLFTVKRDVLKNWPNFPMDTVINPTKGNIERIQKSRRYEPVYVDRQMRHPGGLPTNPLWHWHWRTISRPVVEIDARGRNQPVGRQHQQRIDKGADIKGFTCTRELID